MVVDNTPFNWTPVYFFIIIFSFLLYANTINHDFTVDDGTVIANNSFTKKVLMELKIFSQMLIALDSGIGKKVYTAHYQ